MKVALWKSFRFLNQKKFFLNLNQIDKTIRVFFLHYSCSLCQVLFLQCSQEWLADSCRGTGGRECSPSGLCLPFQDPSSPRQGEGGGSCRTAQPGFNVFFLLIFAPYIHITISGWWLCRDSPKWACSLVQRPRHRRRCPLGGGEAVVQALEELLWCLSAFLSSLRPFDIPWHIQGVKNCCNSIVGICSRSFFQILVYKGHHITSWQGVCQDRRGKKLNSIQMACPRGKYIVFVSFV